MNKLGLVKWKQAKPRKCRISGATLFWIAVACAGLTCGAIGFARRWHLVVHSGAECSQANATTTAADASGAAIPTSAPIPTPAPIETTAPIQTPAPIQAPTPIETPAPTQTAAPIQTPAPVATGTTIPTSRPSFLFFGDSLTELGGNPSTGGWVARLQYDYTRSITILNRGLSGWTTASFMQKAFPLVTTALASPQAIAPALITLWFGTNDAALVDGPEAGKHVDIDKYRANLILILETFRHLVPQTKLLLVTPPVVSDAKRRQLQLAAGGLASDPLDRNNEQAAKYAAACGEAADHVDGVAFLNLHAFFMDKYPNASDREALLNDGIHFTALGNALVYGQVKQQIQALVPATVLRTAWNTVPV